MTELKYKPFVPSDTSMKELTFKAVFVGVVLAIILGAANAYLGLKAGMTVAAAFPAAVIAMAVLRPFGGTILEENIARTTASVGEALAAGAIFTIPAFVMAGVWTEFNYLQSTILMLVGGVLGVMFVFILRKALVHDASLPYPESVAAAEIVKAGQAGSTGAGYVFSMIGVGGIIQFFKDSNGLQIVNDKLSTVINLGISKVRYLIEGKEIGSSSFTGGALVESPLASPALIGVGYIIGPRLSAVVFSGGVFGWMFLMPLVLFFNGESLTSLVTSDTSLVDIAKSTYSATIKPVAVGAMLVGAFYTLYSMRNNLIGGIKRGFSDIKASKSGDATIDRTEKDLPLTSTLMGIGALVIIMIFLYTFFTKSFGAGFVAAIVMAIAGFLFAAIAGYLVGIIGSSSNPISGLTLTTLLIAAILMVGLGMTGTSGVIAVLGVASVVCCVAGIAGDMMQDLKVGHILGGTPWRMQVGELIGVVITSFVLIFPLILLHQAYPGGIGGDDLPAPQAGLMAMMANGIVGGEMAWPLVIAGMLFAVGLILIKSPSPMIIAVGMYLPFNTTAAIFLGGIIRYFLIKRAENRVKEPSDKDKVENTGILLASGLIAGEALMGIILAIFVTMEEIVSFKLPSLVDSASGASLVFVSLLSVVIVLILAYILIKIPLNALQKK